MRDSFDVRLLKRSLGQTRSDQSVKSLYGAETWVKDLDIVNELGGHTGCVNALSWSTSGALLASGSDDTYLNIWDYNPANLAKPFTLNTSVSTGHHANIFSVKFMPHSNDRTVVSCAGDSEVRVFDLEYTGATQNGPPDTSFSTSTRSRRFNDFFSGARWLSAANTNVRVYRSHADRAKRVVTESSPHLFLTCSEDGEVRQWDLRQPSAAYPPPRGGRGFARLRRGSNEGSDNVPPPLISYKRYALDLNSISCAASQPQYIALGGAHLHCFLHDRRMLGRDLDAEKGRPWGRTPAIGSSEDEAMGDATRCVKRFAPNNRRRMGARDHGHITACKISDANPNELIASWSGDHIYSFDIVKSPDAREADRTADEAFRATRLQNQSDRKRKRAKATASSCSLTENPNPSRRSRRVSNEQPEEDDSASRVRHERGQLSDIRLEPRGEEVDRVARGSYGIILTEAQKASERVAKSLAQLRRTLFDFSAAMRTDTTVNSENSNELTPHTPAFTHTLGQCSTILPQMDEIIRSWSYPVNPSEDDVTLQNTLRRNRQASWRFVQASGTLARVLGGKLQTLSTAPDPRLAHFSQIRPAAHEGKTVRDGPRFCYDFLKAILCWLEGGQEAVLQAFKRPATVSSEIPRFPLDQDDTMETFVPKLRDYLTGIADAERPVVDLDANRFERDETLHVFSSQKAAVQAFTRALVGIQLELGQGESELRMDLSVRTTASRIMDKGAAARFWGVKVGRSLLMEAADGITFEFVNRAFDSSRLRILPEGFEHSQENIGSDDEDEAVEVTGSLTNEGISDAQIDILLEQSRDAVSDSNSPATTRGSAYESDRYRPGDNNLPAVLVEDADDDNDHLANDEGEEENNDGENESEGDPSDSESDDDDDDDEAAHPLFRRRAAFGRSRERASVNQHVAYSSHTRVYKGHCNTRTVKDVNYYGLNDEYVVSGSDDGHFFIWDRKTTKVVNVLEGDGEVVNVVQGHPYEPMIACSGIDSTVKIFGSSGDNRERHAAARGITIANPGGSVHSSLRLGGRRSRSTLANEEADDADERSRNESEDAADNDEESHVTAARGGLASRKSMHKIYEITSQNDAERRRGIGDAFVTESMLARFAAALQRGQIQTIGGQGFGGTGGTIVVDDNCLVM